VRAIVLLLLLPVIGAAADQCPWLNAATAGGVLSGRINSATVEREQTGDDASCTFRRDTAHGAELRIEVKTMLAPASDFGAFKARCHSVSTPLKAIGNEALVCRDDDEHVLAEQVMGRVRNRAFVVRISTADRSTQASTLRENARDIAEQVAGILF